MAFARKHDCEVELHKADLKVTPARLGVLAALEQADMPLDVSSVINFLKKQNVKADKATVFRIVNALSEKGIVQPIQLREGKLRYEKAKETDHHHLVCQQCGSIEDISDCNIAALEKDIEKKKKFTVKSHSLEFFGVCKQCQR